MGLHAALAVHPDAGRGISARIAGSVAARLRELVDRLDLLVASTAREAEQLPARSPTEGLDVLIVLGGDGAAHQAVRFCAGTDGALGLVPCGTGNGMPRALGIPADPLAALDALAQRLRDGRRRTIDLARRCDLAILAELATFHTRPVVIETNEERLALAATLVAVGTPAGTGKGPVYAAGEPMGSLPLALTCAPEALRVVA